MTLFEMLIRIDIALAGNAEHDAAHAVRSQSRIAEDPIAFASDSDAYYLSDGGYSRLIWSWEERFGEQGGLALSAVSRDTVKERWHADPEVRRLAGAIQDLVREALRRHELGVSGP
jgi:hypothetical protein